MGSIYRFTTEGTEDHGGHGDNGNEFWTQMNADERR